MVELFDYIAKLKELDSIKDELRELKLKKCQQEESMVSLERPTKEINDFCDLLSSFKGEIDLVSLILGDAIDPGEECIKIKTSNQAETVKMASNLRRLVNLNPEKLNLTDISKLKQKLQDGNVLRKKYQQHLYNN